MNIQTLTKEEIKKSAPAVYATQPKASMTDRYSFVQTDKIIEGFNKAGWEVTKAFQSKTKKDDIAERKHVVRLSNPEFQPVMREVGSLTPEIILINSHNGTSSIRMELGLYRLVCSNGLVISDTQFAQVKRRHFGIEQEEIFNVIYDATKEFNDIWGKIDEYKSIKLTNGQRLDFASKVIEQHWGTDSVITPDALLLPRRTEDKNDDLFSTYNVIQENVIKGGANYMHPHRNTVRRTRAIKNADRDIRINTMLWAMTESFRLNKKFTF
jgi:hypothetical protein